MTPVGFEPTQLALVELESTPLDHSGKVSLSSRRDWRLLSVMVPLGEWGPTGCYKIHATVFVIAQGIPKGSQTSGTRWHQVRYQAREWRNLQEVNTYEKPKSSGTRWNQVRNQAREWRNLREINNFHCRPDS